MLCEIAAIVVICCSRGSSQSSQQHKQLIKLNSSSGPTSARKSYTDGLLYLNTNTSDKDHVLAGVTWSN